MTRLRASKALLVVVGVACLGTWLNACDAASLAAVDENRYRSPTGPVRAEAQRPGDPAAGYHALVNAPYVGCGIPYRAYRRVAAQSDPRNTLPGRDGLNAELPYHLTAHVNADGVQILSSNCLFCHAARLDDELVLGLGNEFLDFTDDPMQFVNDVGV